MADDRGGEGEGPMGVAMADGLLQGMWKDACLVSDAEAGRMSSLLCATACRV